MWGKTDSGGAKGGQRSHGGDKRRGNENRRKSTAESIGRRARTQSCQDTRIHNANDSQTEILGPSLVAGALGRKLGDARTAAMISGMVECRVELMSTREKAKQPVPAAPANSAEPNSVPECVGASDARLSLSVTDQNIQLKLPRGLPRRGSPLPRRGRNSLEGNKETTACDEAKKVIVTKTMGEATIAEPRRISLTSVKKLREERPLGDEVSDRPGVGKVRDEDDAGAHANVEPMVPRAVEIPAKAIAVIETRSSELETVSAETITRGKAELERKWVLRDIDVAMAMREHLAVTNPELDTATSFLGSVCGRPTGRRGKIQDITPLSYIFAMEVGRTTTPPCEERIPDSVPTARMTASADTKEKVDRNKGGGGDVESDSDREEAAVVVLDDTDVSQGESSGEESRSRSSFGGSSSGSWRSRASRKRAAEESPDRDYEPPARQAFPGVVSRGKSGCRIYVPNQGTGEKEAMRTATSIDEIASTGGSDDHHDGDDGGTDGGGGRVDGDGR